MEVILKKNFYGFNYIDLENWLNEQGRKGLRLSRVSNNNYIFDETDKVYYYRMAFIKSKWSYAEQQNYINQITLNNFFYICRQYNWAYFFSTEEIKAERSVEEKKAFLSVLRRFFARFFVFVTYLLIIGYNYISSLLQGRVTVKSVIMLLIIMLCIYVVTVVHSKPLAQYKRYKQLKMEI